MGRLESVIFCRLRNERGRTFFSCALLGDWVKGGLQISQGYIIRILQHFATKRRNITNFVMLFQAVMKFLSRLV
jgi:hypothetical protein